MKKFVLSLFISLLCTSVYAENKILRYHVTEGKKQWICTVNWFYTNQSQLIVMSNNNEVGRVFNSLNGNAYSMHLISDKFDILCDRDGNILKVKGTLKGKTLNKHYRIDKSPWYAIPEISLKHFVLSGKKEKVFWAIRSTDFSVFKMRAIREKTETVKVNGKKVKALKVRMTLASRFLSLFWSGYYWFDSSGKLVLYRAVQGRHGPETVRQLIFQ